MEPFSKTNIRISFHTLMDGLTASLLKSGFVICGVVDFQKEYMDALNEHHHQYKIITVDLPRISTQMISRYPYDGVILPICISVIEVYPGDVSIVWVNPTELLAIKIKDDHLLHLAKQTGDVLNEVLQTIEERFNQWSATPDLVTSWG